MGTRNGQNGILLRRLKQDYRMIIGTLILIIIAEFIGPRTLQFGPVIIALVPMMYSIVIGTIFGKDILGFFTAEESESASAMGMIAIALFMAKLGVSAGGSIDSLVSVGPALLLQEFGNIATILISVPVAVILGLPRGDVVGATHSINRETNLALITSVYGPESDEMRGTLSIYIVGSLIGTAIFGVMASLVASTGLFHPLALGMASGVGSGSRMAAAVATLSEIYPAWAEQILVMGGASDILTGLTGVYIGLFLALPITKKYTDFWISRIGKNEKGATSDEN